MPRPKQTPEQIAAMRERILDAALALVSEQGPQALTIRAIAKQVGVSHMVLYTYFENRAALVAAFVGRQRERMKARRAEIVRRAEAGDVREALRESLASYALMAQERPQIYRYQWVQPIDAPHHTNQHYHLRGQQKHLAHLIQLGIERGIIANRDPDLAAAAVLCIVNTPHILHLSGRLQDKTLHTQLETETLKIAMDYLFRMGE